MADNIITVEEQSNIIVVVDESEGINQSLLQKSSVDEQGSLIIVQSETDVSLIEVASGSSSGIGLPAGGLTGQVLAKSTDDPYDVTWITRDHETLTNKGVNTHAELDTHVEDDTLHFTEAQINHQNIAGSGTYTHTQIDTHIEDATIHATASTIETFTNKTITDYSNEVHANMVHLQVRNVSGDVINQGQPVKFVGYNIGQAAIEVDLANSTTDVSIGIAENNIANNSSGLITVSGIIKDLDTSSWPEGAILYVDGAGILTDERPLTGFAQPIAYVLRSNVTNGIIQVLAYYPLQDAADVRYVAGSPGQTVEQALDSLNAAIAAHTGDATIHFTQAEISITKSQVSDFSDADYATAAQGALADSATQPGDNISTLTNDSGFITDITLENIGDLSDIALGSPIDGQVLTYQAGNWINATPETVVTDHGLLDGLSDDDHPQYHNDARGDARYYTQTQLDAGQLDTRYYTETEVDALTWTTSDITDLASYTGFDARYYTEGETDTLLAGKSDTTHNHDGVYAPISGSPLVVPDAYISSSSVTQHQGDLTITESQISDLGSYITAAGVTYEQLNTNGDVGTSAGQLAIGNHTHVKANITDFSDADYATAAQGTLADSATQPGDNISTLTNDAGYLTDITEESIGDLADVGVGSPITGHVLTYNQVTGKWENTTPSVGVTDHGLLSGLDDDDHTQYHNDARGDARYYTQTQLDAGQLDNRYYTETEVDGLLTGYVPLVGSPAHIDDTLIRESAVTQHEGALTITESQISDLQSYITSTGVTYENLSANGDIGTGADQVAQGSHLHTDVYAPLSGSPLVVPNANIGESSVTQHQAALSITESQISDLQSYLLNINSESIGDLSDVDLTGSPAPTIDDILKFDGSNWVHAQQTDNDVAAVWGNITGTLSNQSDLQTELNGKSNTGHTHTAANITDFSAAVTTELNSNSIDEMSDVSITNLTNGQVLIASGSPTTTLSNRLLVEADISDLQAYLTSEVNDLTADVTWANVPDANITQSSVTQHQGALSITESQISDFGTYLESVVEDTTPQLGGDLDTNGYGIYGTDSVTVTGLALQLYGGSHTGAGFLKHGGDVDITSGTTNSNGAACGDVNINGGAGPTGTSADSGSVNIWGGNTESAGTGDGGDVDIRGGSSTADPGNVTIEGGWARSGGTNAGGEVKIHGGQSSSSTPAGDVVIYGGINAGSGDGGSVKIMAGDSAGSPVTYGNVSVHAAYSQIGQAEFQLWNDTNTSHTTGNYVALKAPAATSNHTLTLPEVTGTLMANVVEDTSPQLGGDLDVNGFDINGSASSSSKPVTFFIKGGENTGGIVSGRGGDLYIEGGNTNGTGSGSDAGNVVVAGGTASGANAVGGDVSILAGEGRFTDGAAGVVTIEGGYSAYAAAGGISIKAGAGGGNGSTSSHTTIYGGGAWGSTVDAGHVKLGGGWHPTAARRGVVQVHHADNSTGQAELQFWNDTNTSHTTGNYVAIKAPATTANRTWTLPDDNPSTANGLALVTDGSGNLSFADSFVKNNGDTMTGDLVMGTGSPAEFNNIINLADPVNEQDAATKVYIDELLAPIYDSGSIGTSTTNVDITGLNLAATESYRIVFSIINGTASTAGIYLTVNGDNTITNYYRQSMQFNDTTTTGARLNSPSIAVISASKLTQGYGEIMLDYNKRLTVHTTASRSEGSGIVMEQYTMEKTADLTANLTSIRIASSVTNGIGVGSRIRIYRTLF